MPHQASEDFYFPEFPALCRCIVVDSSFQSRREMLKDIKASTLFEEIIEAQSLEDGIIKLRQLHIDACFIGPSIHLEATPGFIERAKKNALSDDCAYILIYRPLLETTVLVADTPAHIAVGSNAGKREFTEATIRGVLRANKNSPWPGIRLDESGNILMEENGKWRVISREVKPRPPEKAASKRDEALNSLRELARSQDTWNESEVVALLRRLMAHPSPESSNSSEDETTRFLLDALEEWRIDNEYSGARQAAKNLRRRLQSGPLKNEVL